MSEAVLLKLLAALPAANRHQTEVVSQHIHVDPTRWHHWAEGMSAFWLRYSGYFAHIEQIGVPDADGWVPVTLRFDIEKVAWCYVLGFGAQMEVIEPRELRDRVV